MKEDVIIKQIHEFISENRYKQAVLIDGRWGSGKTYFVKEKLMPELKKEKTVFYISLFGVDSDEQILDQIYSLKLKKYIKLKKPAIISDKFLNVATKCGAKIVDKVSKKFKISFTFNDLRILADILPNNNTVIIFDDLERCNIEICQLFGTINNLMEHDDIKVILVADQSEIKEPIISQPSVHLIDSNDKDKQNKNLGEQSMQATTDPASKLDLYNRIKEKIVGITIKYDSDFNNVVKDIIEEYVLYDEAQKFLLSKNQLISNWFDIMRYYNIRTLIYAVIAFEKFFKIVDKISYEPKEYIDREKNKILEYTINSAIHIKSGKKPYLWEEINKKAEYIYSGSKDMTNPKILGYKFVDDYFLCCDLDDKEITEVVNSTINREKEEDDFRKTQKSLEYKNYNELIRLEDENVIEEYDKILDRLKNKKYPANYFPNIIITFMQLKNIGFEINIDECIKYMEDVIQQSADFNADVFKVFIQDTKFEEEYKNIIEPLLKAAQINEENNKAEINNLINETWDSNFELKCKNNRDKYIQQKKFLYYVDIDIFKRLLENAKTCEIYNFVIGIGRVYNFTNLDSYFKADIPKLNDIIKVIESVNIKEMGKTKKIYINILERKLNDILNKIEK